MRNTSRYYQVVSLLAIALVILWISSLSDNPGTYSVSELPEKSLPGSDIESGLKIQQNTSTPALPELQSNQDIETPTISRQSATSDLNMAVKVAAWGTIQTEYGETTSFDQVCSRQGVWS